mmetsp:Transcript_25652/g.51503  ORF Transcript_25652/g.51503 Transcript_25652/m.51503 type:complete len:134 (-) Transcript_25652:439-840(-)
MVVVVVVAASSCAGGLPLPRRDERGGGGSGGGSVAGSGSGGGEEREGGKGEAGVDTCDNVPVLAAVADSEALPTNGVGEPEEAETPATCPPTSISSTKAARFNNVSGVSSLAPCPFVAGVPASLSCPVFWVAA